MKKFLQIHMLTSYPPANLNRDDLGRPKTAVIGGTTRLRVSSQSLKRAWRTSSVFQENLGKIEVNGQSGVRTKRFGKEIYDRLIEGGVKEKDAITWTRQIAENFGKLASDKSEFPKNLYIEQLAFISPEEQKSIFDLVDTLIKGKKEPTEAQLKLLREQNSAADVALFGRMLASDPLYNIEAAAQVAHAFSVQKVTVEDDFFTAVDDLNQGEEDMGAGHMGDVEFASGIFYTYINIDRELLLENLNGAGAGSEELMKKTIAAFVESAATVAPTGKQNTFGSRAYSHYIMAELGDQQPRSLSLAFVNHIKGDMLQNAVKSLEETRDKMEKAYGACSDDHIIMNVLEGKNTITDVIDFCTGE